MCLGLGFSAFFFFHFSMFSCDSEGTHLCSYWLRPPAAHTCWSSPLSLFKAMCFPAQQVLLVSTWLVSGFCLSGGGWTLWTELNLHPYAPSEACFRAAALTADRCPRSPDQLRGWCWSCRWARVLQFKSRRLIGGSLFSLEEKWSNDLQIFHKISVKATLKF